MIRFSFRLFLVFESRFFVALRFLVGPKSRAGFGFLSDDGLPGIIGGTRQFALQNEEVNFILFSFQSIFGLCCLSQPCPRIIGKWPSLVTN